MGSIVILASCEYYFIIVYEKLVQHPSNNKLIAEKVSFVCHDQNILILLVGCVLCKQLSEQHTHTRTHTNKNNTHTHTHKLEKMC